MNMKISYARGILKNRTSSKLFVHSLGVEETALRLATVYGFDKKKAALAGLLHDYGKIFPKNVLYRFALKYNIVDDLALQEPALLHAPVGAWLLEHELGIVDQEILEAVRRHTTGFPTMIPLAKIVYLADYIEPGRNCPGVQDLREIAFSNLDRALFYAVSRTMSYVLERKKILHPFSVFFRNSLILSLRKNNRELENDEGY
jgi:predicted HD superfamily hydrolase involved in NAD metabolism